MNENHTSKTRRKRRSRRRPAIGNAIGTYRPLLARWLIEMALSLDWYRKPAPGRLSDVIASREFIQITGIIIDAPIDGDGNLMPNGSNVARLTDDCLARILEERLAELLAAPTDDDLPLMANLDLLARMLGLSDADKAILAFAVSLQAFGTYRQAIARSNEEVGRQRLAAIVAGLSGLPETEIAQALREDATLLTTGIVRMEPTPTDLENKLDLMEGLAEALLMPGIDAQTLITRFMKRATDASLTLTAFSHLARDVEVVVAYLRSVIDLAEPGANVLFHGVPGTGKTELAKVLAEALGVDLFEVAFSQREGRPITGEARLRAYSLCQTIASRAPKALLMFDEVEDVFSAQSGSATASDDDRTGGSSTGGKAWINRTLERNPVPTIWITNDPDIDHAYLRRFDYSVRFPVPPHAARIEMARHHFADFVPTETWLAAITANEEITPAQFERAARLARLASTGNPGRACGLVEQALDRSATLLGQKRIPVRAMPATAYDLNVLNTDTDIPRLIEGMKHRPYGSFCFYGPAGTGKSELGRHLANAIGRPSIVRRGSDILSKWVGGTEKNIAGMFCEARETDAVLILDEADSFLADRRDARANWEVTQVNELLTQMEAYDGVFICTTNLLDRLDQASLRRFVFKVKFDYLTADQRWYLFRRELERLGGEPESANRWEAQVRRLEHLTPGDFAVAARQFRILGEAPSAAQLHDRLRLECVVKGAPSGRIGFTA
jgi:transitional endoplasmic reticulum ATPase